MKHPDWTSDRLTYGNILGPAMDVQTEDEAAEFLTSYVDWMVRRFGGDPADSRVSALANIGYWTGYCDRETAERVMRLFNCAHPVFGRTRPSAQDACRMGRGE